MPQAHASRPEQDGVPQDLLELYFRELGRYELLTAEDEVRLGQRIEAGRLARQRLADGGVTEDERQRLLRVVRDGEEAFDQFVRANLRLVVREAAKAARRSPLELGELIQEGNLGLLRAVQKYDWRRGLKFSTYAMWWIRQALQRGIANKERLIRLPAAAHANLMRVRAAERRLDSELGREPTDEELAEATGLTPDKVRQARETDYQVTSLDKRIAGDDDGAELGDLVAQADDAPAEEVVERLFVEDVVDTARRELPARSWRVLTRRFGLDGTDPATLQEVGDELGLSHEAVRKIERQALARLQRSLVPAA